MSFPPRIFEPITFLSYQGNHGGMLLSSVLNAQRPETWVTDVYTKDSSNVGNLC